MRDVIVYQSTGAVKKKISNAVSRTAITSQDNKSVMTESLVEIILRDNDQVQRASRLVLYIADDLTPSQLAADMDDNLFCEPTQQSLSCFVQTTSKQHWTYLQSQTRRHSLSLTVENNCNNFMNRLLFKDIILLASLRFVHGCVLSTVLLKKWWWWW